MILQVVLSLLLFGFVVLLWLPLISELACLIRRRPVAQPPSVRGAPVRFVILVPAHNEELLITGCVRSLLDMSYPSEARRIIVIADNCTDATARLVRQEGAECLERTDPDFPGKPRAIDWALPQIDLRQWDCCLIVDADSTVASDFAWGLAELAPLNNIVIQANIGVLNENENWLTRLGGLLSRCRYEVTYPLKQAAGLNCPITGNGMGFGTDLLLRDGWQSFSITEDSELFAVYTCAGVPIRQAGRAQLFSQEPRSMGQGATQRRRWLAGRITVIRDWGSRILRSPHIGWLQKLDTFVELGFASPVLHLMLAIFVGAAALLFLPRTLGWLILGLAIASLSGLIVTVGVALRRHPQPWRTGLSFFMLPVYAVWRVLLLIGTLLTLSDTRWRKTSRTAPV